MEYKNHNGYKKIGLASIYNIDCMELMSQTPDKFYDLCIVDPPYGIGEFCMTGGDGGKKWRKKWNQDWNYSIPNKRYFDDLSRISEHQIIWGANYYNCFDSKGGAIVWFKDVKHPNMSKCEIASTTKHKKVEYVNIVWQNVNRPSSPIHPCEKPVKLYEWLLTNYAKPGQKIFDSHMGSGSSAIACNNLGFEFVGCELDPDYFESACKRIEHHAQQERLFA